MIRITGLRLPLDYTDADLRRAAARALRVPEKALLSCERIRQAVDARHRDRLVFILTVQTTLSSDEQAAVRRCGNPQVSLYTPKPLIFPRAAVQPEHPPVVIGSGPAGLFAALVLAEAGLHPVLLERGEDVDTRQKKVETFRWTGRLDTRTNIQFGEGGAGTFSDGKLNTGIRDPRCRIVLERFVACGAPADILWQAAPHVGTDRLRKTIKNLRAEILQLGGEVRFGHLLTDLETCSGRLTALMVKGPDGIYSLPCTSAVLAIGHSARDTFAMLQRRGQPMEQKPFAVGVRIEHPRTQIDKARYGRFAGHPRLGAADYKLSCRPAGQRGVYSFCMCPGGEVVAAASEAGGVTVNGMSEYARDAVNSNAALLVGVGPGDFGSDDPLAGVSFQRRIEQAAFRIGGGHYRAPVQLVGDFLAGRASAALGDVVPSYRPGVTPTDLRECLPEIITEPLRAALPLFGRQIEGFDRPEAILTGVETRSSSPVRLLRGEDGQSALRGLYPCGEGAGYAGGIMSAAVDGIRTAERLIAALND